ncbi:Uncharacterised protein [Mycobacteroides abscessus subsp. abscessus]|nr:Uncharacterised protein [Mycobacteroides abscessus subsp. abscessus]
MNTVGPTTNTKTARISASTMLMFDSHWIPLAIPDTADATNAAVSTAMIATRTMVDGFFTQPTLSKPEPICSAPSPSDATVPNSVAKIARMSMILPTGPFTELPSSGAKTALMSWLRPRR